MKTNSKYIKWYRTVSLFGKLRKLLNSDLFCFKTLIKKHGPV